MRLQVKFLDDPTPVEATIIPGDTVKLERAYKIQVESDDTSTEHVLFLAYVSLARVDKARAEDFEAFLNVVEDIDDPDAEDEEADPLDPPDA